MPTKLHMIAYVSEVAIPEAQIDTALDDIVKTAKRENKERHITGVLFHVEGKFLQVIEGREEDLRQLMENIANDPRHKSVQYIIDDEVHTRGFSKWNMDVFRLGKGKAFDAETFKELTEEFKKSLLPRSDMLVYYYKTLLREKTA